MEGKDFVAMEEEGLLEVGSPGIVVDELAELRLLEEEEAAKLMPPPPPLTVSENGSVTQKVSDTKVDDEGEEEGEGRVPGVAPSVASSSSGGSGEGKKKKKKKKKKNVGAWATYAAGRMGLQMVPRSTESPTPAGEGVVTQATPGSSGLGGGTPAAQGVPLGAKRKMDDRSPQEDISRKKSLREETYADKAAMVVITKVMISHKDMTCGTLQESHRSEIQRAVNVAMVGSKMLTRLRMERIALEDGRVAVHCSNEDTVRWVKDSIPTVLDGRFIAWEMRDLPPELRYEEWYAFMDVEEITAKELLDALGDQNEGLMVKQWRLLGIRKGPLSKGNPGGKKVYWITFAIPVGLVPLLETVAHRPYCLSGRLGVMRRGGQRPGGVEPRR
ncbi:unnamed protein product [Orchesella dallaii]|uniref:DUF4780 domain-containing protein n=1 Tax=Orchesella dallaii TaxID=48710 RepID=A0ABP1Q020_9HEXA